MNVTGPAVIAMLLAAPVMAQSARTIIVMDGSGSMWGQIDGVPKLTIARDTVTSVLGTLPDTQDLGLMAYGHREKGQCSDIELVVPPAPGSAAAIAAAVADMRFLGKTPLSDAVRQAAEVLRSDEEAATVVLVTDGVETCDADPCALGRELEAAGLDFTAHVIGFGLTGAEGAQVACLATETGGQYIAAGDGAALRDALTATVTAQLPPAQPLPEPEPTPVLPAATLDAPDSAPAGSVLRVGFSGPHEEFDYIRVLDAAGDWQAEAAVGPDPFVDLRLPFDLGAYELVYLFQATEVIARQPLQIVEAPVSLTAPDTAPAGSMIDVDWTGPGADYDYITLTDADGGKLAEVSVGSDSPVRLQLPWHTGDVTLNYFYQSEEVIASRPLVLTEAPVAITAPQTAQIDTEVTITWVGPDAEYDNIQLYRQSDDSRITYQYLGDTDQLTFLMPSDPGIFEFRYVFGDTETIHVQPITVTLDKAEVQAPAATPGAAPAAMPAVVPVSIAVPAGYAAAPIMWDATPLDPDPAAPEALAMPEPVTGPWLADLTPGRWRIYGEAPAGVTAGQGFLAEITVTAAGQSFEIPLTPFETMGMGEDPPAGDMASVTIRADGYDGEVAWSAMPMGGSADDRLAHTTAGGWDTVLTPGPWAIFGMADGATFFGQVDVAAGTTAITIPREGEVAPDTPPDGMGEDVAFRCDGPDACAVTDPQTGLAFTLPAGWFTDLPFRAQTAAGVVADQPTMTFMSPEGAQIALNPVRWIADNGPCAATPAGALCVFADADDAVLAASAQIAASLTLAPGLPADFNALIDGTPVTPGAGADLSPLFPETR